mgnify:CR=1 FL=1
MNANVLSNSSNFHMLATGFDGDDTGLGAPSITHAESKVGAFFRSVCVGSDINRFQQENLPVISGHSFHGKRPGK